jgi:hypothetical protein
VRRKWCRAKPQAGAAAARLCFDRGALYLQVPDQQAPQRVITSGTPPTQLPGGSPTATAAAKQALTDLPHYGANGAQEQGLSARQQAGVEPAATRIPLSTSRAAPAPGGTGRVDDDSNPATRSTHSSAAGAPAAADQAAAPEDSSRLAELAAEVERLQHVEAAVSGDKAELHQHVERLAAERAALEAQMLQAQAESTGAADVLAERDGAVKSAVEAQGRLAAELEEVRALLSASKQARKGMLWQRIPAPRLRKCFKRLIALPGAGALGGAACGA